MKGFVLFSAIIGILIIGKYSTQTSTKISISDSLLFIERVDSIKKVFASQQHNQLFHFNPNIIDSLSLRRLGFSEKQTMTFLKYSKAGGQFHSKEDFRKLYFITDSLYRIYAPFLVIKGQKKNKTQNRFLFIFNPNTLSKKGWDSLKLPKQVKRNAQRYIAKGGRFQKAEDLKKIYGLSDAIYNEIKGYIQIPSTPTQPKLNKIYELNTVKQAELAQLNISKKTTQIFLNFRKALGGFYSKEQLNEVYGISPKELKTLQNLHLSEKDIAKINLNTASTKTLAKHPYIEWAMAKAIVKQRNKFGEYKTIEDLKSIKNIDAKTFQKIKPYLNVRK